MGMQRRSTNRRPRTEPVRSLDSLLPCYSTGEDSWAIGVLGPDSLDPRSSTHGFGRLGGGSHEGGGLAPSEGWGTVDWRWRKPRPNSKERMSNWLRRLGMGGRRDRVEGDVERLAQRGEFHVKQPDETEAQASLSSEEQPISPAPETPEAPADDSSEVSRSEFADEQTPTDQSPSGDDRDSLRSPDAEDSGPEATAPDVIAQAEPEEVVIASTEGGTEPPADVHATTEVPDADLPADADTEPAPDPDSEPATEPDVDPEPALDDTSDGAREEAATQEEESPIAQHDGATTAEAEDDSPIARELADLTARRKALDAAQVQLTGRTRVLTVSNQKGGVGKTTTTVNLAAALAERGARVLVIDLDPQGNASTALGVPHTSDIPSVYDVLIDEFPLADIIQVSPESPNLLCAPSTIHLAGAEIELVSQVAREHRLRVAVDEYLANHEGQLDFILIDCPPSLGLLTINAFTAATELLIPIQCEYYALEGLSQLLGTVRMIQKHLNPRLELSTIMLTMYDGRTRLAQQVADEVREHFPKEVLETIIPRSVRVSEAPSFGQSVLAYDGQSAGAIAYREAAVEMIRRDSASNERGI